jgi:hypothetical protein
MPLMPKLLQIQSPGRKNNKIAQLKQKKKKKLEKEEINQSCVLKLSKVYKGAESVYLYLYIYKVL